MNEIAVLFASSKVFSSAMFYSYIFWLLTFPWMMHDIKLIPPLSRLRARTDKFSDCWHDVICHVDEAYPNFKTNFLLSIPTCSSSFASNTSWHYHVMQVSKWTSKVCVYINVEWYYIFFPTSQERVRWENNINWPWLRFALPVSSSSHNVNFPVWDMRCRSVPHTCCVPSTTHSSVAKPTTASFTYE